MGLPPLTEKELEEYRKHLEELEFLNDKRKKIFEFLDIKPIPEERFTEFFIKLHRKCPSCNTIIHNHPLGAIKIGDFWYSWLDLEHKILGFLYEIGDINNE